MTGTYGVEFEETGVGYYTPPKLKQYEGPTPDQIIRTCGDFIDDQPVVTRLSQSAVTYIPVEGNIRSLFARLVDHAVRTARLVSFPGYSKPVQFLPLKKHP